MLLFRSEEHVERWCERRQLPKRPLITLEQLWQLAVHFYGNRLTDEARRPTAEEIDQLFSRIGLTGEFWRL